MPRGGDPTLAAARRSIESADALPDRLTIVDDKLGVCEVHLTRVTSYQLYKLLDIDEDENGELYAAQLKENALATAATVQGDGRTN